MRSRRALVLAILLFAVWGVRSRLTAPEPVPYDGALERIPADVAGWHGRDVAFDPGIVAQTGVEGYLNRYYRSDAGSIGLYVGYYASQKEGDAVHSPLNCLPGSGWQPLVTDRVAIDPMGEANASRLVNKVVVVKGLDQQLVLYWYQTAGRVVASEYLSKALLVKDAFSLGRTDIALVRIIAPIDGHAADGAARALAIARPFAERILPEVQRHLFRS